MMDFFRVTRDTIALRHSETYILPKNCYLFEYNIMKNPTYELQAFRGYSLDFISRDPTGQAASQIGLYGKNTPLNTFYCKKKCGKGFYYDFNSISCRRCSYGCTICKKFEECELCEAGFRKVKKPIHSVHKIDEEMVGLCQLGCQSGFHLSAYDGECLECGSKCLKCMDTKFVLKGKYDQTIHNPSFCVDCHQESAGGGAKNIINMTTGVCQLGCDEKASNGSIIQGITNEYCHVCEKNCLDCEIPDTSKCLSCPTNYYFQEGSKKCVRLSQTLGFWMVVTGVSLFCFILCSLRLGLLVYKKILKGRENIKEKAKKKNQERKFSALDLRGQEDFRQDIPKS